MYTQKKVGGGKVADVADFWNGQKEIKVLDPNITACREKRDLMRQYVDTGAGIDFTQGIDIRLVNNDDIADLNRMKIKMLHFAWDNPNDNLEGRISWFVQNSRIKDRRRLTCYVLTNYNSTLDEDLHRVYTLRRLGVSPYVMVYNKPSAPKEIMLLQRWVNNKMAFNAIERYEDYDPKKEHHGRGKVNYAI